MDGCRGSWRPLKKLLFCSYFGQGEIAEKSGILKLIFCVNHEKENGRYLPRIIVYA